MKLKSKREKNYAYNINSTQKNGFKNLSFKMLTGNFYEDLINSDINLIKKRQLLSNIKNKSIKESVYCNKEIPKSWKTILGYSDEVYKAIDQDPEFAFYVGASNKEKKTNEFYETKLKNVISTADVGKKKFLNLDNIDKYIKDNNIRDTYETEKDEKNIIMEKAAHTMTSVETKTDKSKRPDSFTKAKPLHMPTSTFYWGMNNDHVLNDKLISSKLDEYRTKFDMNKFMNEIRQKRARDGKDKEMLNYVPNFIKERKNNYRETLKMKTQSNKENVLKNSIYSNLLPSKDFNQVKSKLNKNLSLPKLKKQKFEPVNSLFLNVENDFDTPIEITNPKIKRDLELINYFGPRYTNCHVCRRRNIEFYQNSEPKQTLVLLHYLKKVKLNDDEEKKPKKTNEQKE
jgi:hypothetical protein